MNPGRIWQILRKDLELGPRSPVFLWAIVMPVVATVLLQLVFGSLFAPEPRLAIVDMGSSEITAGYLGMQDIDVEVLAAPDDLEAQVKDNRYDAGLILPTGFDDAVRRGEKPALQFFVSGRSLASNRVVLAATTIDLIRTVEGATPPVGVEVVQLGADGDLDISDRLVPLVVIFSLLIAGVFLTGTSLVEEKERRTLSAILVSPVKVAEVLIAKAMLGLVLAVLMSVVTLALNGVLGSDPFALVLSLLVAGLMCVEVGLLYGAGAKDMKSLYALFKGLNIFLFAPVIFYLFPNWPQWLAKILPTYWAIDPIFQVAVNGGSLADVWLELVVALAICAVLGIGVVAVVRRMERELANA